MNAIRADKIIINSEDVRENSVLMIDAGIVHSILDFKSFKSAYPSLEFVYLENSILTPAYINCHTHSELSADLKITEFDSFTDWIKQLLNHRQLLSHDEQFEAAKAAIESAFETGTVAFGDISNTGMMIDYFTNKSITAHTFLEVLGFQSSRSDEVYENCLQKFNRQLKRKNVSLTPHSPYGVSKALLGLLKDPSKLQSIHIDESMNERIFLEKGTGELKEFLNHISVWDENWNIPNLNPYDYIKQFGYLENTLLVHCLNLTENELAAMNSAKIVLCPRSNHFLHNQQPNYKLFEHIDFAFGTDSLASCSDLSILNEMKFVFTNSNLEAKKIFKSGTEIAANFMNFDHLGTLETGMAAICNYYRFPVLSADPFQQLLSENAIAHSVLQYD